MVFEGAFWKRCGLMGMIKPGNEFFLRETGDSPG
jgi:hypothetical protein